MDVKGRKFCAKVVRKQCISAGKIRDTTVYWQAVKIATSLLPYKKPLPNHQ